MNEFGKVYENILDTIKRDRGLSFLVLDPPDLEGVDVNRIAELAEETNFDAFAVGGSVGAQGEILDNTIRQLKESSSLPVILFPGNIATVSKYADAIYFMSLLNSRDPYYITGAQIASAVPVKRMGLEVIPTSYVILEPGQAVGWVGSANLIPRTIPYLSAITALAGQYLGSKAVILESGSGAPSPAPKECIAATRKLIDLPIIVAGGVKNPKFAYDTISAGADIVHIGSAINDVSTDLKKAKKTMFDFTNAVKKAGKEKK